MPGKAKAALLGAIVGGVIAVLVELMAVAVNDEPFFGSEQSWLILGVAVVAFAWAQMRAYDRKKGIYKDEPDDQRNSPRR